MPSAVRGAASPWFTGAGSDLLVVKVSIKYLYATTQRITDRLTGIVITKNTVATNHKRPCQISYVGIHRISTKETCLPHFDDNDKATSTKQRQQ